MSDFIQMAEALGFRAVLISPDDVPVDYTFRRFCEENTCGQYKTNYSCPPSCGSAETMHQKLLSQKYALVLQTVRPINGYDDTEGIEEAKRKHIQAEFTLLDRLRAEGYDGFCVGAGNCGLCKPCGLSLGKACIYPEKRYSCMSAYCIDVEKICALTGLPYVWDEHFLYAVGLIAFR